MGGRFDYHSFTLPTQPPFYARSRSRVFVIERVFARDANRYAVNFLYNQ
jgi:hypothetical protein